ncbi:hypothetical protein, partial [Actinoplanes sp. GCM10030250]|uniref:hypothetical protein n=1 Tax=Actinoplanes sp. GCM10030250 TaxID=3273376 RepID=UPI00361C77A5
MSEKPPDSHQDDAVRALAQRIASARAQVDLLADADALTDVLSQPELDADRAAAEKQRALARRQKAKVDQAAAATDDLLRQADIEIMRADVRDLLEARKALAAQRRESSPHAQLAGLARTSRRSTLALFSVVAAGMAWSAVNVQQNLAPGGPSDPLYWFSFLIEAMISVCLITLMFGVPTLARFGVELDRRTVTVSEVGLLALTVTLNIGRHVSQGHWYDAGTHAIAPVMIAVAMVIHNGMSPAYAQALREATKRVPADEGPRTVHAVSERTTATPTEHPRIDGR